MKYTNVHDLPPSIVRAIAFSDYEKGDADISVTGLLKPGQIAYLEAEHEDELEEDITEATWRAYGTALHILMQRADEAAGEDEDYVPALLTEERFSTEVLGWKVSGQIDRLEADGTLEDFKSTSAWTLVYEPKGRKEWHQQLNLYALLLREHGYPVRQARIVALFKDHSKRDLVKDTRYPRTNIGVIDIPLWTPEKARAFLEERVRIHQAVKKGQYESCSDEDRWRNSKGYARCIGYCLVNRWCNQWKRELH